MDTESSPTSFTVSQTLRVPLAVRAFGDAIFPRLAVRDRYARAALAALGDDGSRWIKSRPIVYGVLSRTRIFRDLAREFLAEHPSAQVVNLGCGLSQYFQWFDNGQARMLNADLPEVIALRAEIFSEVSVSAGEREREVVFDLSEPGWWDRLGLPSDPSGEPVFLLSEGVLMYLGPEQVEAVCREFGERAPAGSVFAFDALWWRSVGQPAAGQRSADVGEVRYRWGLRRPRDLMAAHMRLRLGGIYPVMRGYSLPLSLAGALCRCVLGVPLYAVYVLRV